MIYDINYESNKLFWRSVQKIKRKTKVYNNQCSQMKRKKKSLCTTAKLIDFVLALLPLIKKVIYILIILTDKTAIIKRMIFILKQVFLEI